MNAMKIKGKLLALALACAGVPATVVGQPSSLDGAYQLTITVQGMPSPISAFAICKGGRDKGYVKEIACVPTRSFFGFGPGITLEKAEGRWYLMPSGEYAINTKTQLRNGLVRQMDGTATLTGDQLTGRATVKLLNQDGSVLETRKASVTGERQ
jgi:hypothetical protein